MKLKTPLLFAFALAGLAGCGGLGDGNTVKQLKLVKAITFFEQGVLLDDDTVDERLHMYNCFCSNLVVQAIFDDGTVANFNGRATFSSDNPALVTVLNLGESDTDACPLGQQAPGMLIPKGLTGSTPVTITAQFGSLKDTLKVEVVDVSDPSVATLSLHPPSPDTGAIAVGGSMLLQFDATLDGRQALLNNNVTTWSFVPENDDLATVNSFGEVRGVAASGASPLVAQAAFGACSVTATTPIQVGDILPPLALNRESGFADDSLLAVDTTELLDTTAALDFDHDGSADGNQKLSLFSSLSFTDTCTLRTFSDTDPNAVNGCLDTANSTCSNGTPTCSSSLTTCTSTTTACRLESAPIASGATVNQIRALSDQGTATQFTSTFPILRGTDTTLTGAIDGVATTITVAALTGYPNLLPWFGVIDGGGTREDVRVTAVDGTTLTVVRAQGFTAAAAHASGASFGQRSYTSAPVTGGDPPPLALTAQDNTLMQLTIDAPGTLDAQGTLQLEAQGSFVDASTNSRRQRVSRLIASKTGSPTVSWTTSDGAVAVVDLRSGRVAATGFCGGHVSIRARASTSTDTTTETFDPDTTNDDTACKNTDPLCDQVELCVATPTPLPLGATACDTVTTCP